MLNTKNSSKFTKNTKILIGLAAFLTILYMLSFTKSCTSKDSRERVKTSLVNQKYKDSIKSFELQDSSGSLTLTNMGSFWTVGRENENQVHPAASEHIENLFENLIKIRNLYKISDKITEYSAFGLTNGTEFHLRYNTEDSFHELIFGNQDFSLSSRYLMTEKSTQVYEIDNSLDSFLTSSIQSWAEPYLVSREVSGSSDIQTIYVIYKDSDGKTRKGTISDFKKLLDLRHGELPFESEYTLTEIQDPLAEIQIEKRDKSSISIKIFQADSELNSFIVKSDYYNASSKYYTSYSKISSWTYNKIKEITL